MRQCSLKGRFHSPLSVACQNNLDRWHSGIQKLIMVAIAFFIKCSERALELGRVRVSEYTLSTSQKLYALTIMIYFTEKIT